MRKACCIAAITPLSATAKSRLRCAAIKPDPTSAKHRPLRTTVGRAIMAICAMFPAHARAADPTAYTLSIDRTGNPDLDAAITGSAQLAALRTTAPAGPFALVARARQDLGRVRTALDSFGYYQAQVSITVAGHALDDPTLPDTLTVLPQAARPDVTIHIDHGPLFHLRRVSLDGAIPAGAASVFTLRPGAPAVAADVLQAGSTLLTALQERGYAMARVDPPAAILAPDAHVLDVAFHVAAGPRVDLGPITFTGLQRTHPAYLRRRLLLHPGQLYQPSAIEAARQDLSAIGVFSGVKISAASHLDPAGQLPLRIDVTERKLHAVTLDAAFSTDLGGSLGVTWTHRNLFGNAEQLNLSAAANGLGGSASKGLGYAAKAQLLKPDYYRRDQTLELDLAAIKQNLLTYDQTAVIAGGVLSRKLSRRWTASVGVTATEEQILQEGTTRTYTLLAVPVTARYDSTDVPTPLTDPTRGIRGSLIATPTESLSGQNATFVILQGAGSTYFDLHRLGLAAPGHSVLAVRGLLGTAQGATEFQLPPDQRFYGGGSSTVRGYKYQSIGPQFRDGTPQGGTAIDAATLELRQHVWHDIGAVLFLDAGQVSTTSSPFSGRLEEGAGVGARYYTPIGPVRVDIAVPLTRQPHGDSFELYLGLGQAF